MRTLNSAFAAASAAIAAASPAGAAIVYQNDFDGENGGVAVNNYAGFRGIGLPFAQSDGDSVDLIADGDAGRRCAGGRGLCVDLDGRQSSQIRTTDYIAFSAGDLVTWTFDISGSQVASSARDMVYFGFRFEDLVSGTFSFSATTGQSGSDSFNDFDLVLEALASYDLGFQTVNFSFRPDNAGRFQVSIDDFTPGRGDADNDGFGRIVDNFIIDVSPTPEPATWSTMILGFGLVGAAARRRRGTSVLV